MKLLEIINKKERLTWEEYFMGITLLTSLRSPSIKKQVGCVIVKDNRIISTGYNGFPAGTEHKSIIKNGKEINTIHAEQNAISQCAKMGIICENSILYVSHYPCINCSKIIVGSGIKKIYYLEDRKDEESKDFLKSVKIEIKKLIL